MPTVIDRYILRTLLFNYLIALGSMLSLYVVLDMFVNMDEFTEVPGVPLSVVAGNIVSYYLPHLLLYFSQLSGSITLFACMATLARMRKSNELTAVLASGVSLYRVAAPVVAFGLITTTLLIVDTEWAIPSVASKLARDHDDADGTRVYSVLFLRDRDDALLSAAQFDPVGRDLHQVLVLQRDRKGNVTAMLEADHATWEPAGTIQSVGRWRLDRGRMTRRVERTDSGFGPVSNKETTVAAFYESNLSPDAIELRQSEGWIHFLSLSQLAALRDRAGSNTTEIIQKMHTRRVAPIIGIVMLLLGLPFFLDRSPANILTDSGKCLVVCGLCYVSSFVVQSLRPETVSSWPSWIPIFIFGTLAVVLVDRIRT